MLSLAGVCSRNALQFSGKYGENENPQGRDERQGSRRTSSTWVNREHSPGSKGMTRTGSPDVKKQKSRKGQNVIQETANHSRLRSDRWAGLTGQQTLHWRLFGGAALAHHGTVAAGPVPRHCNHPIRREKVQLGGGTGTLEPFPLQLHMISLVTVTSETLHQNVDARTHRYETNRVKINIQILKYIHLIHKLYLKMMESCVSTCIFWFLLSPVTC